MRVNKIFGGSTVEQLRSDIDHGRTGDKVDWSDPAAAPLGADEEAAGTPVPANLVGKARSVERRAGAHEGKSSGPGAAWILIGFLVVLAVVIPAWALWL
jgi:hypothetical protein